MNEAPYSAGTQGSESHEDYLLELGRATFEASCLAGISFDLLRVFGDVDSAAMYDDPMGTLVSRLGKLSKGYSGWEELSTFVADLDEARVMRNDLLHALPVHNGLHRRRSKDGYYVRNFFTVESLSDVYRVFHELHLRGNQLLYSDGGAAATAWYERQRAQD
jgi:hypothetical protein